jgi:hypothetical protein
MSPKNLIIVARYNEDIKWARDLDGDIVIYNKGTDWPWKDIPRIDTENYGREGETFVRAIIEFYENLDHYDNVVFLQGNPQEHCKDFKKVINFSFKNSIVKISDFVSKDQYPSDDFINGKHFSIINILLQIEDKSFKSKIDYCNPNELSRNQSNTDFFLFEETMGLCSILDIDYQNKIVEWANGGQYIVPIKNIKYKSKQWWENLHMIFEYISKYKQIESWTYALERIWPLILDHKDL